MRSPLKLTFDPFPEIETERLLLCQISKSQAVPLLRLRSENAVMRYIERPRANTLEEVYSFIDAVEEIHAKEEGFTWTICMKEDKAFVGNIGFFRLKKDIFRGELGYAMLPEFWGQGIMSEAIQAALDFGFNKIGFNSIEADINPANEASAKILLRNGFQKEGYLRENVYWNGEFLDTEMYSILHSDWKRLHP
jgi:[ribosomal protein S5]-alanine N-acetyltransferase